MNGAPITYTLDLAAPLVTVLAEQRADNQTTYVYGLGDSPLAGDDGTTWRYLTGRDALNSVRQETDAAGQVLSERRFDPYGVPLEGDGGQPFGYAGESWDGDVQLQWLRARWYQPATGRFLSRDPWSGDDTQPLSYNPWLYGSANPLTYRDPSGRIAEEEATRADQIIDALAATYNVRIPKDYSGRCAVWQTDTAIPGRCTCMVPGWNKGAWRLDDLEWTQQSVQLTANAMGGAARFRRAMQGRAVDLKRWPQYTDDMRPFAPAMIRPAREAVRADIVVNDYTFGRGEPYAVYSIIHEFGHVWDARMGLRLSYYLGWQIGTLQIERDRRTGQILPLRWNPYTEKEPPPGEIWRPKVQDKDPNYAHNSDFAPLIEDWAEAFASTIYPAYYGALKAQDKERYREIGPLRKAFVLEQIAAIR